MATVIDGTTGVSAVLNGVVEAKALALFNATGDAPVFACRAWVNFNGTGTVAIRASGNVSSITDNGTGDYSINFTVPMPDVNYSCVTQIYNGANASTQFRAKIAAVNFFQLYGQVNQAGSLTDSVQIDAVIFR